MESPEYPCRLCVFRFLAGGGLGCLWGRSTDIERCGLFEWNQTQLHRRVLSGATLADIQPRRRGE